MKKVFPVSFLNNQLRGARMHAQFLKRNINSHVSLFSFLWQSKFWNIDKKKTGINFNQMRNFACGEGKEEKLAENVVELKKLEEKGIAIVTLNRSKALNALNNELCEQLVDTLKNLDKDDTVRVIVLTGNEKAFAAGADIKAMKDLTFESVYKMDLLNKFNEIKSIRKPVIAGVNGYALGGGCELAMMCDIIIAGENAIFGQPEVNIGTIPGMGGSQRLTLAVGKSRAMEYILTGKHFDAKEALKAGLVSRVVPTESLLGECVKLAENIAQKSLPIVMAAKECINRSYETSLQEGLHFERRLFNATFATEDLKEGMSAFVEKRTPMWKHK